MHSHKFKTKLHVYKLYHHDANPDNTI